MISYYLHSLEGLCPLQSMKNMWDLIGSEVGAGIGTVVAAGAMTPAGWAAAIAVVVSTVIGQNLRK